MIMRHGRNNRCRVVVQAHWICIHDYLITVDMLLLLLSLGPEKGELLKDKVKFSLVVFNLGLKVLDVLVATTNRVRGTHVRLEDDGAHGLVLKGRVKELDDLGDVADTKQFMGIEELPLAIVREIRCENAVRCTLPTLVLACRASLRGAAATIS